jgi:hypothetical protein
MPIAAGGLTLAGAAPAQAACTTNSYIVRGPDTGVYPQPSEDSHPTTSKNRGDRVTGPSELQHVRHGRYTWTGVDVNGPNDGRRGWMHAEALDYIGCN